jgi:hypothetical protein
MSVPINCNDRFATPVRALPVVDAKKNSAPRKLASKKKVA